MKKGLINIIAMVLTLINLILTAVLVFAIVPTMNSSNEVITKIAELIDLDVSDGSDDENTLTVDEITVYSIEDSMTITMADDGSGTTHYAVLYASVYFDETNEYFDDYYADVENQEPQIQSYIDEVVSSYTYDEFDKQEALDTIKEKLNDMYGTDIVYKVVFSSITLQ